MISIWELTPQNPHILLDTAIKTLHLLSFPLTLIYLSALLLTILLLHLVGMPHLSWLHVEALLSFNRITIPQSQVLIFRMFIPQRSRVNGLLDRQKHTMCMQRESFLLGILSY
jgi:hypothetical protein